jgi:hypothetical protein
MGEAIENTSSATPFGPALTEFEASRICVILEDTRVVIAKVLLVKEERLQRSDVLIVRPLFELRIAEVKLLDAIAEAIREVRALGATRSDYAGNISPAEAAH